MPIPESFLEELTARSDIADVVGSYVSLTRKGNNLWGLCPFHSEKTPSFSVCPGKQMYYCFGCHKGGGVINFIMEIEGLSYIEAVRFLAQRANLQVPEDTENAGVREKRKRLWDLNREAARYYHKMLLSPAGAPGAEYLRGRKLTRETVTRFGLGYAPEGWDGLITAMAELGYSKGDLLDAGLAVSSDKGHIYDRFRNRVMFPIIDLQGRVIGFGGRVLDGSEPKYLNSPETMVFNKRRNLFALNLARKTKLGRIVLTEGYMDTISMYQGGFDCAVASLGTALTPEHAQLLSRYTGEVVLSYDGDAPGIAAAQRAIPILRKAGLNVRVLRVTGAKDPDEYLKTYGPDAFRKLIEGSADEVDYRMEQVRVKYNLTEDQQKVEYLKEIAGLLAALDSAVERDIYGKRAAELAGVDPAAVRLEVERERKRQVRRQNRKQERQDLSPATQVQPRNHAFRYENVRSALAEEGVVRLMVLEPGLIPRTERLREDQFSSPVLGKYFTLIRTRQQAGLGVSLDALAGELEPEEMSHLASVVSKPETAADSGRALDDYISTIETESLKHSDLDDEQLLRAAQKKYQENKRYGG